MENKKITKSDLVAKVVDDSKKDLKTTQSIVDSFLAQIKDTLLEDNKIEFRGFGTFEIRKRKGRDKARNPKTGELVKVCDHGVVVFRPGKDLKEKARPLRAE